MKMAWGEVYEFEGEEMERVLKAIREDRNADLVERLAEHCHDEQWSGWMKYMLSKCEPGYDSNNWDALVIPNWAVERWTMQMNTPYADLPEEMKESDREEARKILEVLEAE